MIRAQDKPRRGRSTSVAILTVSCSSVDGIVRWHAAYANHMKDSRPDTRNGPAQRAARISPSSTQSTRHVHGSAGTAAGQSHRICLSGQMSPWERKYNSHNLGKGPRKGCNFPSLEELQMPLGTKTACDIAPDDSTSQPSLFSLIQRLWAGDVRPHQPHGLEMEESRTGEHQTETNNV